MVMREGVKDRGANHVPAGQGGSYWLGTDLQAFKAVGDDTGGAFALSKLTAHPQFGPPHIHHNEDESYYVLEGEFMDEGRTFAAGPGTFVSLPKGRLHAHRAAGDAPARALVLVTPAGVEKFIEEAGEPATDTSSAPPVPEMPQLGRIVEIAQKYGIEVPPPPGR
jgi:quercetin dioxygenase-like cupin family protein